MCTQPVGGITYDKHWKRSTFEPCSLMGDTQWFISLATCFFPLKGVQAMKLTAKILILYSSHISLYFLPHFITFATIAGDRLRYR